MPNNKYLGNVTYSAISVEISRLLATLKKDIVSRRDIAEIEKVLDFIC